MEEKGLKNFNEGPSNNHVYDAVSPPQNSGLYSSPASSNNSQQNLINPTNQITYNLSHINHPSLQQGSSGFANTGILKIRFLFLILVCGKNSKLKLLVPNGTL